MRSRGVARVLHARHPEIGELDAPIRLDQQIGRFDIAVNNALAVRVVQGRQQIVHDPDRLRQAIAVSLIEVVLEIVALNQLHDQKGHVTVTAGVIDTDDIGMLQAGRGSGFNAEPMLVIGSGLFGQVFNADHFHRDVAFQIRVAPFIHQAHRTFAKDPNEVVTTQLLEAHEFTCVCGKRLKRIRTTPCWGFQSSMPYGAAPWPPTRAAQTRSRISAMPCPTPIHMVHSA